jgi:hypothetical protein
MLSEKEISVKDLYEKRLALPKWKFVLIHGVLGWGLPVAIAVTLVDMWIDKKSFNEMLQGEMWVNLAAFPLAGIIFGLVLRRIIHKKYLKLKDKEQSPG